MELKCKSTENIFKVDLVVGDIVWTPHGKGKILNLKPQFINPSIEKVDNFYTTTIILSTKLINITVVVKLFGTSDDRVHYFPLKDVNKI